MTRGTDGDERETRRRTGDNGSAPARTAPKPPEVLALADPDPALRLKAATALLASIDDTDGADRERIARAARERLVVEDRPDVAALLRRAVNRVAADGALDDGDPSRHDDAARERSWERVERALRGERGPDAPAPVADDLAERYEVLERIAAGGMARIFRGRRREDGADVAIKILLDEHLTDGSTARRRFEREADTMQALDHPRIARVLEHGTFAGRPYLVLPLYRRGSLANRLSHGPVPVDEARALIRDAAEALDALHARGLVHRDVKPGNILIDDGGRGVLTDFGLLRDPGAATLTRAGDRFGSPAYMAPEQKTSAAKAGPPADVYALGVSLYEALTGGRLPEIDYTPAHRHRPAVPSHLDALIVRCLAERPKRRPTARDVVEALT